MTASAGKTSLIQAALFPKLKQEGFHLFPIMRVNLEPPAKDLTGLNRYILSALLSLEEALPQADRMPLDKLAQMEFAEYLEQHATARES